MNGARLTWSDYPIPRVVLVKGKYSVEVSIPRRIRHLFGSGKGGTTNIRKATGTSDRAVADKMLMELGNELYAKLDQKQLDAQQGAIAGADEYAVGVINRLAKTFNYNGGDIPKLESATDFDDLYKLKVRLDSYTDMESDDDADMQRITRAGMIVREAVAAGVNMEDKSSPEYSVWSKKINASFDAPVGDFSNEKRYSIQNYSTKVVQSYFQDLLTKAALEQGIDAPVFEVPSGGDVVETKGIIIPSIVPEYMNERRERNGLPLEEVKPVERQRQVLPPQPRTVSSVMDEYLKRVDRDYETGNTRNKLKRWILQFLEVMGDLEIAKIKPIHGYDYCDRILERTPTLKHKTLKDYIWGVQVMLNWCVQRNYIDTNPFYKLDIRKFGGASEEWEPYEKSELKRIFSYDWSTQDRLLLSILATTGMRPTEAGNLTWERFNDTEHEGIRYFSLKDTATEKLRIKNKGSKREVPLHPELVLPEKGTGRLFDYEKDEDGRCGTDIGHKINEVLDSLVPHPRKSARSFRRTFKVMLRDVGVKEEVHDAITGHNQTISSARKNYGGMGARVKFEAISKLDITFLKG
jgi:integrase